MVPRVPGSRTRKYQPVRLVFQVRGAKFLSWKRWLSLKQGWRGRETWRRTGLVLVVVVLGSVVPGWEEGDRGEVMETMSPMQRLRSLRWAVTRFSPKAPGWKAAAAEGNSACQVG
jgi:hypothetical protein